MIATDSESPTIRFHEDDDRHSREGAGGSDPHSGAKTKREAVVTAVADFNRRRRLEKLVRDLGTFEEMIPVEELIALRTVEPYPASAAARSVIAWRYDSSHRPEYSCIRRTRSNSSSRASSAWPSRTS